MADESVDGEVLRRRLVRASCVSAVVQALVLVGPSGRWDWWRGWACVAVSLAAMAIVGPLLLRLNPAMLAARLKRPQPGKPFDRVFMALFVPGTLVLPLVGAYDGSHRMPPAPWATFWLGVAIYALGCIPIVWSMAVNPFTEMTVRIQDERGHRVIRVGPYRWVRHPMYVGCFLVFAAWPLLLGSSWAWLPAVALIGLMLIRTGLEDRMLREELPGYADYARETRWRVVPGVW